MRERNNFDFLRLVAATMVFASHAFPLTGRPVEPLAWTGIQTLGGVGVVMFFAISGYLVTQSWLGDPHPGRFLARRALRLYPGLVVVVLLTAFVVGPMVTALPFAAYLTNEATRGYLRSALIVPASYRLPGVFTHNPIPEIMDGPLWTLPMEGLMYLVLLLLGMCGGLRPAILSVALGAVATSSTLAWSRFGFHPIPIAGFDARYLLEFATAFLVGANLFVHRRRIPLSIPLALGGLLASTCLFHELWGRTYLAIVLAYASIVFADLRIPFIHRAGRWGDVSYGVYVYAYPVQQVVVSRLTGPKPNLPIAIGIALPATLLCAYLSWHVVEAPMLRLKPRRAVEAG